MSDETRSWIRISEQPPPYGKDVLVYRGEHSAIWMGKRTFTNGQGEHFSLDGAAGEVNDITHWMPLPERPR